MISHYHLIEEIEDSLPQKAIDDICQSGSNDLSVEYWANRLRHLEISKESCIAFLREYGCWTFKELNQMNTCKLNEKVIWLCAWNVFERT